MSKLTRNTKRETDVKKEHIGNLIIFCEGNTEYNYFNYFCEYIRTNTTDPYANIELIPINTKGNARKVFKYANDFLDIEGNSQKYSNFEKHLVFDCDAPKDIQDVINDMKSSLNNYHLDYTYYAFETWLVMHYYDLTPKSKYKNKKLRSLMKDILDTVDYTSTEKADEATIKKILASDGNEKVKKAIENAKTLAKHFEDEGNSIFDDVKAMNPSTNVHLIIERIMDEIEAYCN